MNTHEKTGNAGTFPSSLIIKISARNTSVNKQSNYKYMNFWNIARPEESRSLKNFVYYEIDDIILYRMFTSDLGLCLFARDKVVFGR